MACAHRFFRRPDLDAGKYLAFICVECDAIGGKKLGEPDSKVRPVPRGVELDLSEGDWGRRVRHFTERERRNAADNELVSAGETFGPVSRVNDYR